MSRLWSQKHLSFLNSIVRLTLRGRQAARQSRTSKGPQVIPRQRSPKQPSECELQKQLTPEPSEPQFLKPSVSATASLNISELPVQQRVTQETPVQHLPAALATLLPAGTVPSFLEPSGSSLFPKQSTVPDQPESRPPERSRTPETLKDFNASQKSEELEL